MQKIEVGRRIPYGYEIRSYQGLEAKSDVSWDEVKRYQTDLVILEGTEKAWKPRLIIEAKKRTVTTHDAITYSQKALSHKTVHPYIRYGIMLGERKHYPLPGRLYRHGAHFDFMISFSGDQPTRAEMARFEKVVRAEIDASRQLEEIIFKSLTPDRNRYTVLHKRLCLE